MKVYQGFSHFGGVLYVIVDLMNDAIVATSYSHRGLVALNLANAIKLINTVALFDEPLLNDYFADSLANIGQIERHDIFLVTTEMT